jgi:hypothetical protein
MTLEEIARQLAGTKAKKTGKGWLTCCPAHDDKNPSLSISEGSNGSILVYCHAGCSQNAVLEALETRGIKLNGKARENSARPRRKIVATYDYRDEQGMLLFQVVRYEPKNFQQRRPDGNGGWLWNLHGVQQVPYQLPEVLEAVAHEQTIVICEGEKDCISLSKLGVGATTNAGGANKSKNGKSKWRDELTAYFKDVDVVLIPDNDSVGRAHVEQIATRLKPLARRLRVLDLAKHFRDCPAGGDISDWLAKGGGSREKLDALIAGAPDWDWAPADDAASPNGADASPAASKALPLIWTIGEDPAGSDWLYEGLLPRVGAGLISGQSGVGKTSVLLDLCASITRGNAFAGRKIERKGGVLLLATEGQHGLPRRLSALVADGRLDAQSIFPRAESCPLLLQDGALEVLLATADAANCRLTAQRNVRLDFICLDILGAAAGWTDEDDAAEAIQVMGVLLELARQRNCCVAATDHFGKTIASGTRGASPKEDRSDFVLALLGDRQLSGAFTNRRMALRKIRDAESGIEIPYELRPVVLEQHRTGCVVDWRDQQPPTSGSRWSKSLYLFREVLCTTLAEHGMRMHPWPDGPEVTVVDIERVRRTFSDRYVTSSADPNQQRDACRKAFDRAARKAQEKGLVGVHRINAVQWIWAISDRGTA